MRSSRNIRLYNLFHIINSIDFFVPIKIVYFHQITGSYSTAATIISVVWIVSAIMEIPTGVFSDFVGRKKTMLLGAFFVSLAYLFYASGFNLWLLFFGAFLEGASRSFFSGNNDAFLHDSLADLGMENEYHHYYGKVNSFLSVSAFLAAFSSGFIANVSFSLVMWLSAFAQFASFIIVLFMKDISFKKSGSSNIYLHLKDAVNEVRHNLNLRYLSLASIFGGAGQAAYEFQIAVVNSVWPTWAIGIFRALQEVGGIPGYYFAGKIIKRLGMGNVIMFQTIISWVGNILASLVHSVVSPVVIATSLIFYGPSDTANQSLLQKEFTDRQRATIASLNSLGSSIYFSIVVFVAGLVANKFGPPLALITTQIFFLPVIYYRWALFKRIRGSKL